VLINRATSLRQSANLPIELWPEIYCTAGYLLNRSPTRQLNWNTPIGYLQQYIGIPNWKPILSHIERYGCKAYVHIKNRPKLNKLENKAFIGYLVGYDSTNIFRIWIPSQGRIIASRDVVFDPSQVYDPTEEQPVVN